MIDPYFFLRWLPVAGATALGAGIGSFLNVCIYRIPIGLTVTEPKRSFCPSCRTQYWTNFFVRSGIPALWIQVDRLIHERENLTSQRLSSLGP